MPRHDRHRVLASERRLASEHFVQHAAQAVQIGGRAHGLASGLLWGHVHRRPDGHSRLCQLLRIGFTDRLRDPKVRDQRMLARQQNILWLHVAMDDALLVRKPQCTRYLDGDANGVVHRKLSLPIDAIAQRLAFHKWHDVVHLPIHDPGIEHAEDVRMLQPGRDLDFTLEAVGTNGCGHLRQDHLDGDFAIVFQIVGEIHRRHSAAA